MKFRDIEASILADTNGKTVYDCVCYLIRFSIVILWELHKQGVFTEEVTRRILRFSGGRE